MVTKINLFRFAHKLIGAAGHDSTTLFVAVFVVRIPYFRAECKTWGNFGCYTTSIPFGYIVSLRSQYTSKAFRIPRNSLPDCFFTLRHWKYHPRGGIFNGGGL